MKLLIKIALIGIIFLIVSNAIDRQNTDIHEQMHQKINYMYGVNSSIEIYGFFESLRTGISGVNRPINVSEFHERCLLDCQKLHLQNEMIGYNMVGIYSTSTFIALIISIILLIGFHHSSRTLVVKEDIHFN